MSAAGWIGPAIIAAVISALVAGIGWYVSDRQAVRRDAARRRERVVDMQTALLAEIRAARHRTGDIRAQTFLIDNQMSQQESYTPFVPRPVPAFVFNAVLAEIHVLLRDVIDPVVIYYRQGFAIAQIAEDIRGDRFQTLDTARKRLVYRDYVELILYADILADRAKAALLRSLNIQALARSDHRSDEEEDGVFQAPSSGDPLESDSTSLPEHGGRPPA